MIVFASTIPGRLRYILDFIGKEITGEKFSVTDKTDDFINYDGPKINYSRKQITKEEVWLYPHTLLFENEIKQIYLKYVYPYEFYKRMTLGIDS